MLRVENRSIDPLAGGSVGSVSGAGTDPRTSETQSSGAKSDSVSLSSAAALLALVKSSAGSRQAKLQGISADVKSGKYQADPSVVSQALVESHISA